MTPRSTPPASRPAPPDFAIVGAPKCGTTALYGYLAAHPDVAMSARKEPLFWSADVRRAGRIEDREAYDALWSDAPPGALRGEASPEYLRSQVAVPRLLEARPDVRLIAMIRHPVELMASLHSNLLLALQEDVADFEAAWRLQERRRRGEAIPAHCGEPELLQYSAYAALGDQLERFLSLVPAGQRLVILYDDFRADTRAQYLRALGLLGLCDDGRAEFPSAHANRVLRSAGLQAFHRSLRRRLGPLYEPARAAARALGMRPSALVERLNVRAAPRKRLRSAFEAELIAGLLPQIETIERLLGRDLTAWKHPRGRGPR